MQPPRFMAISPVDGRSDLELEEWFGTLSKFAADTVQLGLPLVAIGGISEIDVPRLEAAGAAGVAGISLFQLSVASQVSSVLVERTSK